MEAKINKVIEEYDKKIELLDASIELETKELQALRKEHDVLDHVSEWKIESCRAVIDKCNIQRQAYVQFKADLDSLLD